MKQYRYVLFPGTQFKERISKDNNMRQKLKHILNYYTQFDKCPNIFISTFLKSTFNDNVFKYTYLLFMGLGGFGWFFLPEPYNYITLILFALLFILSGIFFVWFYENAYDYKALNVILSKTSTKKIKAFSKLFNQQEKSFKTRTTPH